MLVSLKRASRAAWADFTRNMSLTVATVFIITIVVLFITFLFLLNAAAKILISDIQDKVDISVYFKEDTPPENISEVKSELAKTPGVKEVEYVSKEDALAKFIEAHKEDKTLIDSLTEIGGNPFLASLNIKVSEAAKYEEIANFLENGSYKDIVEKVDYRERKTLIDKLWALTSAVNQWGIILGIVLGFIAVLVAFSFVRLAIYGASEEIATMRLVGASNWFIRGPFLAQGLIAGLFSGFLVFIITLGLCYGLDAKIKSIIPQVSTLRLFLSNIWLLLLIQFVVGIGLGIFSSLIAIRKYLKI